MTEETNDKLLFRKDRYPLEQAPNLPDDLKWAVGEPEFITGGFGGGQSTVGSIVFADRPGAGDLPNDPVGPENVERPQVPTPRITGVTSSNVYQTVEGLSKADVFIGVTGMDGVEYEVVVTQV